MIYLLMMVGDEYDKRNDEKECKNNNDGDGDNEGGNDDDILFRLHNQFCHPHIL